MTTTQEAWQIRHSTRQVFCHVHIYCDQRQECGSVKFQTSDKDTKTQPFTRRRSFRVRACVPVCRFHLRCSAAFYSLPCCPAALLLHCALGVSRPARSPQKQPPNPTSTRSLRDPANRCMQAGHTSAPSAFEPQSTSHCAARYPYNGAPPAQLHQPSASYAFWHPPTHTCRLLVV